MGAMKTFLEGAQGESPLRRLVYSPCLHLEKNPDIQTLNQGFLVRQLVNISIHIRAMTEGASLLFRGISLADSDRV